MLLKNIFLFRFCFQISRYYQLCKKCSLLDMECLIYFSPKKIIEIFSENIF